jgi:hypothetical protein
MEGHHAASILQELQDRFGYTNADLTARSTALGPEFALGRNWLSNIRNKDAVPDLRRIHALSEIFRLRLGDILTLFGFPPDELLGVESRINADKTRLIEHRINGLRTCSLPALLAPDFARASTGYVSQIVTEWRTILTSHASGPGWLNPHLFYAKLGIRDSNAAPTIPPGSWLQVLRIREMRDSALSPTSIYLVQHPWGMTACRCTLEAGLLYLHSHNPSYSGPFRLRVGTQARILGRVTAFASNLPAPPYQRANIHAPRCGGASPIAPWEFKRPNDLFFEQYRRYGMHRRDFNHAANILSENYGIHVSAKYVEELHTSQHFPRTSTAVALAILTATRLSDLFSSARGRNLDHGRFQLEELLKIDCRRLPAVVSPTPVPEPQDVWNDIMREYREWPTLLHSLLIESAQIGQRILRFERGVGQEGSLSLLPTSSFLLLSQHRVGPRLLNDDSSMSDWARRIYVVEHGRDRPRIDCGYLNYEDGNLVLTSHRSAPTQAPVAFKINDVTILGQVVGIAAALPE